MVGRRVRLALVFASSALAFASFTITPSRASCAPPTIAFKDLGDETRKQVSPGDTVILEGEGWTSDCFDTGPTGSCERGPGDELPMRGIDVDLLQNGLPVARVIEDVTAESDLTLRVSFTVPDVGRGRYRVLVHDRGAQGYPDLFLLVAVEEGGPA